MADCYGGIVLNQELGHGTAYDLTAANDTGICSSYLDLVSLEQFQDPRRRARNEVRPPHCQSAHILRVKAVNILGGINRFQNRAFINSLSAGAFESGSRRRRVAG